VTSALAARPNETHLPTTSIAAETIAVWKEGASADTSQLYTPAASNSSFVSTTCVALLSVFCGTTVIHYSISSVVVALLLPPSRTGFARTGIREGERHCTL